MIFTHIFINSNFYLMWISSRSIKTLNLMRTIDFMMYHFFRAQRPLHERTIGSDVYYEYATVGKYHFKYHFIAKINRKEKLSMLLLH